MTSIKLPYKITFIAVGTVLLLSFIYTAFTEFELGTFMVLYGFIGVLTGAACLVTGVLFTIIGQQHRLKAQGFFLAAGILLLTGFFGLTQISFSR